MVTSDFRSGASFEETAVFGSEGFLLGNEILFFLFEDLDKVKSLKRKCETQQ